MDKMNKNSLLKQLAEHGYNVGFGAKTNFATYDMIRTLPGGISLFVLLIGVGQLAYPHYNYNTGISTFLIMISILGLAISPFNKEKDKYEQTGIKLTQLFNKLRSLYYKVKNSNQDEFTKEVEEMNSILKEYYTISDSNQMFGSAWFAHYKFFYQMQIEWIDEVKQFSFCKDKIPKSLFFFLVIMIIVVIGWYWVFVKGGTTC